MIRGSAGSSFQMAIMVFIPISAAAQETRDSIPVKLDSVVVTVARSRGRSVHSPFSISVIRPDSLRPGQRHSSADESLALVPGVVAVSRNNPSQDPRLSIRGFGSRSAFGVRGVKVLRDGMPLSLPDGQTPLDFMSLESVDRIEIMRGPAAGLYGNASGGVIDFRTSDIGGAKPRAEVRQWLGSAMTSRSVLAGRGGAGNLQFAGDIVHQRTDGERSHSAQRSSIGYGRLVHASGPRRMTFTLMGLDNPLSENPGALTRAEMSANPLQADLQSARRNARKSVRQIQAGASATREAGASDFSVAAFAGSRDLSNPLTFAVVDINRRTYGSSLTLIPSSRGLAQAHRIAAGAEFLLQDDMRENHVACRDTVITPPTGNCRVPGQDRGVLTLDQRERVSSIGAFVNDEIRLGNRLSAVAGLRADQIRFDVRDKLITSGDPDDSGRRTLASLSPMAGLVLKFSQAASAYANLSSAFETPTATELGNQPDGSAGLNSELDPQRSITIEAGARGLAGGLLRYEVAVYRTRVTDELVSFEIPDSDGRRYFRNAGQTSRKGAEAGITAYRANLSLMLSYEYSRFRFERFTVNGADLSGRQIPGIPRHRAQGAVTVFNRALFAVVEGEATGRSYADDANSVTAPGYGVLHARIGTAPWGRSLRVSATGGIRNIFDRTYASSIAVNAAREKYFEPSPKRTIYAGATAGF